MEEYIKKDFGKILKTAGLEARRWMRNTDSNTARVYDRNLEGLSITVDIYDQYARIVDYSNEGFNDDERTEIIDSVSRFLYVERDKIIWKEKKKREGREQHEKVDEECPVEVKENGLSFQCELKRYTDTGLFLDQVETRAMVKEIALNQRVLNLFSYTSSFSVYAASGGAESVDSVDLSNVYCSWSRENLDKNGFLDQEKYRVIAEDCRAFLEKAVEERKTYDIVIFDPPAFSNSHKAEDFDVQKDYIPFLAAIWKLLSDDGVVIFSENLSGFRIESKKLEPWFEIKELSDTLRALNFSKKVRSCRIWEMRKKPRKVKKSGARERKMDEKEKKLDAPERLVLNEEIKTEAKRVKAAPRVFSFDDEGSVKEERPSFDRKPRERREENRDRRRDSRSRDYRDRDNRRNSRDRRDDRDFSRDRRDSRNDRYSSQDRDRRDNRYSDRNDRYSSSRYSDRERYSGRREDYGRDRERSRYSSESRTYSGRRDSDGRRESYKRDSFPPRDRRYSSSRDWDNDTSRMYRDSRDSRYSDRSYRDRDERSSFDRSERKKKSSPKPYGYDSFMENKNREGATAFWLQGQTTKSDKE